MSGGSFAARQLPPFGVSHRMDTSGVSTSAAIVRSATTIPIGSILLLAAIGTDCPVVPMAAHGPAQATDAA